MRRLVARRYMGLVAGLLVAILVSQPLITGAKERYRLPAGQRLTTPQGTFQGFTLEDFKVLLKMDMDLESFSQQIPKYIKLKEDLTKLSINLTNQVNSKDKVIYILQAERARLTDKWTEENRLRHLAENKVSWTTWFAWGAAAVMTVVTAVLAGVLVAKD